MIDQLREQVKLGYVREVTNGRLVLFNYTDKCTYDRHWNEWTLMARGIIFDEATGNVVARPFKKFFNLGEPGTFITDLPNEPYEVLEKLDGSLGIVYHYEDQWHVATRGSFSSEQAVKAQEMLKKYRTETLSPGWTYMVEIIYPDNKIVVNYGSEEKLTLIGAIEPEGYDLPWTLLATTAAFAGMDVAKWYDYTIEQMIALQQTLSKDQEGFVVHYHSGLRVKIKGAEYLKIHKMIANMSPLSFWESMENGKVNPDYLAQLPEEFRPVYEPMVTQLEWAYNKTMTQIIVDNSLILCSAPSQRTYKAIGMAIQSGAHGFKHPSAVFPYLLGKNEAVDKYIMKTIRPHGNIL